MLTVLYAIEMQRLFTMFPAGITGIALMLLRLSVTASLWQPLINAVSAPSAMRIFALCLISAPLLIGLGTPVVGTLAVISLVMGLDLSHPHAAASTDIVIHAAAALSLVLIGPGAFSVDARLFGRRVLSSS